MGFLRTEKAHAEKAHGHTDWACHIAAQMPLSDYFGWPQAHNGIGNGMYLCPKEGQEGPPPKSQFIQDALAGTSASHRRLCSISPTAAPAQRLQRVRSSRPPPAPRADLCCASISDALAYPVHRQRRALTYAVLL